MRTDAMSPDGPAPNDPSLPPSATAWAALALLALIVASPGCGGGGRAAPVDPTRAREALRTALEAWRRGDTPESLRAGSPPIVVQDFDWMAGHRLVAFEVLGEGEDDDANLRIPVALTLRQADGSEQEARVSYVVGTSPALTVFRDFP